MNSGYLYPVYCQYCGSKLLEKDETEVATKCLSCHKIVYLNSKPSVCAVIIRNNKVLLVRDSESEIHAWDLPGGFLLYGESPEDGLKRELNEELDVEIAVGQLLTVLVDVYGETDEFSLNIFYHATLLSNKIKPTSEIKDYRWFNLKKLPPIRYKSTLAVLQDKENSCNFIKHAEFGY